MTRDAKARARRIELAEITAMNLASCIRHAADASERAEMIAAIRQQWTVGHLCGVPRELPALEVAAE